MNRLLHEHGYLDGQPGAWRLTDKAKPFAEEKDHFRGNPNSLTYSASWSTTLWDESILDEIAREQAEAPLLAATVPTPPLPADTATVVDTVSAGSAAPAPGAHSGRRIDPVALAGGLLVVAGAVAAAAPHVRRWWDESGRDKAKALRTKVSRKSVVDTAVVIESDPPKDEAPRTDMGCSGPDAT